ncbi:MAG: MBL fold metallo-hydrolase [Oscillospiraceae bacterium]
MINVEKICVGNLGANCYIVYNEKDMVVIDAGDNSDMLINVIDKINIKPSLVLLTHAHADHFGAASALKDNYKCEICIGENDLQMLKDAETSLANYIGNNKNQYIIDDARPLKNGEVICVGNIKIKVVETKGHTAGGVTFEIEDMLFTGDTLFNGNVGRTDFYSGSYEEILQSVKYLAENYPNHKVFCGHGDDTTMQEEIKNNPYIR